MGSTASKFIVENDISTADPQVTGDSNRIVRVPNCHRVSGSQHRCGVFTIPLTADEIMEWDAQRIFRESRRRRYPDGLPSLSESERPEMEVYSEYEDIPTNEGMVTEEVDSNAHIRADGGFEEWFVDVVHDAIRPPCLRNAAFSTDPHHKARLAIAIELFNNGYSPEEAVNFIAKLPWQNYDRKTTTKQVQQIWSTGYSSFSCEKLMRSGFCVHSEDVSECDEVDRLGGMKLYSSDKRKGLTES